MDEIREETEYEQMVRWGKEQKYKRNFGPGRPASAQRGTDKAPLFWLAFFALAFVVLFYLGTHSGG